MKNFIGIDPGKDGAFVVISPEGKILDKVFMPKIGTEYDEQGIKSVLKKYEYERAVIENPDIIFGVAKSSVASLSGCVGFLRGLCVGLGIPFIPVKPKVWQKEVWAVAGVRVQKVGGSNKNDTKNTSITAAHMLWPSEDFKLTAKGNASKNAHEGLVDAALIAEYGRRMFS